MWLARRSVLHILHGALHGAPCVVHSMQCVVCNLTQCSATQHRASRQADARKAESVRRRAAPAERLRLRRLCILGLRHGPPPTPGPGHTSNPTAGAAGGALASSRPVVPGRGGSPVCQGEREKKCAARLRTSGAFVLMFHHPIDGRAYTHTHPHTPVGHVLLLLLPRPMSSASVNLSADTFVTKSIHVYV